MLERDRHLALRRRGDRPEGDAASARSATVGRSRTVGVPGRRHSLRADGMVGPLAAPATGAAVTRPRLSDPREAEHASPPGTPGAGSGGSTAISRAGLGTYRRPPAPSRSARPISRPPSSAARTVTDARFAGRGWRSAVTWWPTKALEQVGAGIGRLDLVPDDMRQREHQELERQLRPGPRRRPADGGHRAGDLAEPSGVSLPAHRRQARFQHHLRRPSSDPRTHLARHRLREQQRGVDAQERRTTRRWAAEWRTGVSCAQGV